MAGKEPRPPEDWTDTGPKPTDTTGGSEAREPKSDGSIGGPASQH